MDGLWFNEHDFWTVGQPADDGREIPFLCHDVDPGRTHCRNGDLSSFPLSCLFLGLHLTSNRVGRDTLGVQFFRLLFAFLLLCGLANEVVERGGEEVDEVGHGVGGGHGAGHFRQRDDDAAQIVL